MNVVKEELPGQTLRLNVTVGGEDYAAEVEKQLKEYRKKAQIPGFRPGMVPMGVVNKMYRRGAVADVAYRKATDGAFDYIKAQDINPIGDLMPADEQKELDFETGTEFEFAFEIGLAPQVKLNLGPKDTVTRYTIQVDDQMRKGFRSNYMRRFGKLVDVDAVTLDEALTGTLTSATRVDADGAPVTVEDAYVGLISMDDAARKPFIGKKVGDVMEVNVNELYKSPSQRASILGVKETELEEMDPNYTFVITQIRKFAEPEMDAAFFAQAFPDGDVTDQAGFNARIQEQVATELAKETEFKLAQDVRAMLLEKTALSMPEAFLKRWLFTINEGKFTMEEVEKDFAVFLDMMRWDLIQREVMRENSIEITPEQVKTEAREVARGQFLHYGIHTVQEDMLDNYAESILKNKEQVHKIYEQLGLRLTVEAVIRQIKVVEKSVTAAEFQQIVTEK